MNAYRMKTYAAGLGVAALLFTGAQAAYGSIIWGGFVDGDWQDGNNWNPAGVPGAMTAGVIGMDIRFGASPQLTITNADDALTDIRDITFTGATGAFTISGTGTLGIADGFTVRNDSLFEQTINVDIAGTGATLNFDASAANLVIGGNVDLTDTAATALTVSGNFNTTINGVISDAGGGISKVGGGTLTLTQANTYTGDTRFSAGTIIAGDDQALGTGDLVLNGSATLQSSADGRVIGNDVVISAFTFSVGGDNDMELQGVISGNGGLAKKGNGALLLSGVGGVHTYLGQTSVQSGLLQSDNDALPDAGLVSISGATATLELLADETIGALANGGTANGILELNGNTLTLSTGTSLFGGLIQGTGGLDLAGTDAVLLVGANTFSGGVTMSADGSTLALGNDMALGTGSLSLMNNATLMTQDGARVIANDIVFATAGASTLTFGGPDTLTLSGAIDLGGMEQTFNTSFATTLSGVISNGSMRKAGAATLTLGGASTFMGDLNIDAGRLTLDGSVAGATFVNSGGILGGGGTAMGNLTAAAGGIVEPGNGQGTLTVGGNYLQQTGSTLRVDLNAGDSTSDLLDVTGTATLESGSTIAVNVASPDFIMAGQLFRIIEADGGVFDAGAIIDTSSATLRFTLQRTGDFVNGDTDYRLQAVRNADAFSAPAEGGNNLIIGRSLDSLIPVANADPTNDAAGLLGLLDTLDTTQYNQALVELSPERFNAGTQLDIATASDFTGLQSGYLAERRGGGDGLAMRMTPGLPAGSLALNGQDPYVIGQAIDEADNPFGWADLEPDVDRRLGAFARGFGVFSDQDSKGNRTGYESDAYGAAVGIDYRLSPSMIGGLSFAYTANNADFDQSLGGIDVKTLRVGPYMTWVHGDVFVDASLSFGASSYDSTRSIPSIGLEAKGDYDGFDVTGYIGAGYDWRIDNAWSVRPTFSLQYSYFDYDGFTETGGAGANLSVAGRDSDSLRSRVGLSVQYLQTNGMFWQAMIGWQRDFFDNDDVEAGFAVGGNPFTVDAGERDQNAVIFGAGFGMPISESGFAYLRFENLTGSDTETNVLTGGVSFRF